MNKSVSLSGWGNYPRVEVRRIAPADRAAALAAIAAEPGLIARGNGRAYGDAALNPRAVEVLQLAARGCSAQAISGQLGVSTATVKRHFARAYMQLGVSDRAAAVAEAMRRGLIS